MKRSINSRDDIQFLVESFYSKVKEDATLGPIFNDAENFSWETHIPVMVSFWETVLLHEMSYKGNPILKHIELNRKTPLLKEHFTRWKKLFYEALDEHFEGERVKEARKRVEAMEYLMLYKIEQSKNRNFIQ